MIKIIQLATGEQIISDFDEITGEMENPLFINIQQTENGVEAHLHPYALITESPIRVNLDQVIWSAEPQQTILNQYQQAFSKIITPPKVTPIR